MTLVYVTIAWIVGLAIAIADHNLIPIWPAFVVGGLITLAIRRREIRWRQLGLCLFKSKKPLPMVVVQ